MKHRARAASRPHIPLGPALAALAPAAGLLLSACGGSTHRGTTAAGDSGPAAVATAATGAGGVSDVAVHTSLPCYLSGRVVRLSGHGFQAGNSYTVSLDGRVLGHGRVSAAGSVRGRLVSGALASGVTHAHHVITVSTPGSVATTTFDVSSFSAGFTPSTGALRDLRVRFAVYAFGLGPARPGDPAHDPRPRSVYLHYVDPFGQQLEVVRLGRTHGVCGSLPSTRLHRLFFFRPGPGTWQLQFDTHKSYSPASAPRVVRAVVVG